MNKTTAGFGQKLLACFLALAMALSLLPTAALAADETTTKEPPAPTNYTSYLNTDYLRIQWSSTQQNASYLENVEVVVDNATCEKASSSFSLTVNQVNVAASFYNITLGITEGSHTVTLKATGYKDLTLSVTKSGSGWTGSVVTAKYVLMNIPYGEFYAAEKDGSDTAANVDAVSSATKKKTKKENLAAGS